MQHRRRERAKCLEVFYLKEYYGRLVWHIEGMTPQNRAQSTVALITVIRYLMAELAQVIDVADAIARTHEGTLETCDLEEEENTGDHTDMMQRTIKPFLDSTRRQAHH